MLLVDVMYVDIEWRLKCWYEPQWLFSSSIRAEVTINNDLSQNVFTTLKPYEVFIQLHTNR